MKIADFFVQITAKGDLKEIKALVEYQKVIQSNAKIAVAELKKQTETIRANAKVEAEKIKVASQESLIKAKTINEELKAKLQKIKLDKEENKVETKKHKNLKDMLISVLGLNKAFIGIAGSIVLTGIALDRMVTKLAQANQLYSNFQRQTGISMGRAIGVAGAMANLDVTMTPQEIMQNMQNLQNNLVGVQFGMGNIAPYQMAGISPWGINSANMMDIIRKQLKGFAPAYRTFLLQQMGLDPRLGALIDLSDTEYLKYKQEALELYLSPEDRKTIQQLAPEWNKINLKFAKAWDKTTLFLMQDFMGLAKEIGHIIDVITRAIDVTREVLRPIMDVLTMILKPLYYLIDDIAVWLLGGQSVIGDILHGAFPTKEEWKAMFKDAMGNPIKKGFDSISNAYDNPWWIKPFKIPYDPNKAWRDAASLYRPNITNNDKNLSMSNNITINANSPTEGFSISNAVTNAFNPLIAQLQRGY